MQWEIVIGLETHAQLNTKSKIFSGASTEYGAAPNSQACAVDIALPGVLPVMNKLAAEKAVKFGLAIGAVINRKSIFARKNYFYPDLPKGYQISQYELPIVGNGSLTVQVPSADSGQPTEKTVRITRAHLEEDAGKSLHEDFHGMTGIDLNRASTPLLEIVTEPDMCSAAEAVAYAKTLHSLVRWIDICDGNMQEGSFRCDANVSVRRKGDPKLGTRREIKNLNSFRFLQQAIEYEARWQIETLEDGGCIQQATVLFDPDSGETRAMRSKEDAHDYRYFPDPDLLPLVVGEDFIEAIRITMVELPNEMCERFERELGLSHYDAATLTSTFDRAVYFDRTVMLMGNQNAKLCANWVIGELTARLNREGKEILLDTLTDHWLLLDPAHSSKHDNLPELPITPDQLGALVKRIADGTITNKIAKEVFSSMWVGEGEADAIIEAKGLKQMSDSGELEKIIDEVLAANQKSVEELRAGKEKAFNALIGQAMKATKGKANPQQVNEILKKKLAG
jgi:aspartyl-tRNA(Asn)/glutamyl-tRNA(Gln) amidotransferase subunit B